MKLVELHILQTVAPNNLNRDDTGSPKDALFGGFRRARVSSQAQKRAVRVAFQRHLPPDQLGIRTKRLVEELARRIEGVSADDARDLVEKSLNTLGLGVKGGKTEYLIFLGNDELDRLATHIQQNLETLKNLEPTGKKAAGLGGDLKKALDRIVDGGKALDVALFGRMLADRPDFNVDAAAQVAHAISTHKVDREFDFYTAVDDLAPQEETGAGMMGDVEFYSATLYRYAVVDLEKLNENLQGDVDLAVTGVVAFIDAFTATLPSGKQNSFAAHNPPLFVAFRAGVGLPRNLATAFEKPLRPSESRPLSEHSVEALIREWEKFDQAFGPLDPEWPGSLNLPWASVTELLPPFPTLSDLEASAKDAARRILEM